MLFAMVSEAIMASWKTNAMEPISCSSVCSRTSAPPIRIAPESTSQNRAISFARVDLPPPDGPTRAVTVPGRQVSVMPFTTGLSGSYPKVMSSTSMSDGSAVSAARVVGVASSGVPRISKVELAACLAA